MPGITGREAVLCQPNQRGEQRRERPTESVVNRGQLLHLRQLLGAGQVVRHVVVPVLGQGAHPDRGEVGLVNVG